jgi:hypothetical protein
MAKIQILPRWLGGEDAGRYLGHCRDWIEDRALEWQPHPVAGKIRFKFDRPSGKAKKGKPGIKGKKLRRYIVADLEPMNVER